jgi:hypothetical protein
MLKVTAKLNAAEARNAYPWIVGQSHIVGAEQYGAHAVIINGKWVGCCPTRGYALAKAGL